MSITCPSLDASRMLSLFLSRNDGQDKRGCRSGGAISSLRGVSGRRRHEGSEWRRSSGSSSREAACVRRKEQATEAREQLTVRETSDPSDAGAAAAAAAAMLMLQQRASERGSETALSPPLFQLLLLNQRSKDDCLRGVLWQDSRASSPFSLAAVSVVLLFSSTASLPRYRQLCVSRQQVRGQR